MQRRPNQQIKRVMGRESFLFSFGLALCVGAGLVAFIIPLFAWIEHSFEFLTFSSLFEPSLMAVVRFTVKQMVWSTLISAGVGLSLGVILGRQATEVRSRSILSGFALPLAIPTLVAALGWMSFLGRSFDLLYSQKAVILAHCFYNIPLVIFAVAQARRSVPAQKLYAIRTLGGKRWDEWRLVIWPQIQWPFWSACAQAASFCAMSFALVLILGGGPPVQTLETEIFYRLKFGQYAPEGALSCAVWELILTLIPWAIVVWAEKRIRAEKGSSSQMRIPSVSSEALSDRFPHFSVRLFFEKLKSREGRARAWIILISLFFLVPYGSVIQSGAFRAGMRMQFLQQVGSSLLVSCQMAFLTSSFVVFMGVMLILSLRYAPVSASFKHIVRVLAGAPSGVSILILGLGVGLAYGRWLDPFEGSGVAIVLLQSCIFFPIAFRLLWPLFKEEDESVWRAAQSLGASWWQTFWVTEWPRWQAPLLAVWSGVFGACLGEVGVVSLFGSEKWVPLSLLLTQKMQRYRFEEAQAIAGLLFLLSTGSILCSFYFWKLKRSRAL